MQSRSALTESQSHGECSPDRRSRSHRATENAVQIGAHGVTEARRMQSRSALTESQRHGECSPDRRSRSHRGTENAVQIGAHGSHRATENAVQIGAHGVTEPRRMQSRSALTESQRHGECSPDRRSRSHRGTENAVQIGAHGSHRATGNAVQIGVHGATEPRRMQSVRPAWWSHHTKHRSCSSRRPYQDSRSIWDTRCVVLLAVALH